MQVSFPTTFFMLLCILGTETSFIGSVCKTTEDCPVNSNCISSLCQCKQGYSELSSLQCKMDFGVVCSQDSDCNNAMGLHCLNSKCDCSKAEYVPETGSCMNSTMALMYQDVMKALNETESELKKFSNLFHIFMIQSTMSEELGQNGKMELDHSLFQGFEDFLSGQEQNLVASVVDAPNAEAPTPTTQIPSPPTLSLPTAASSPSPSTTTGETPQVQQFPPPDVVRLEISRLTPAPPNSVVFPIIPSSPPNPPQPNRTLGLIPNFIQTLRQFLPSLRNLNNLLGSLIFRQERPGASTGSITSQFENVNSGRLRGSLLSVPISLLQVPQRIFARIFGRSALVNQNQEGGRAQVAPIDFNNRPVRFLPWPLG